MNYEFHWEVLIEYRSLLYEGLLNTLFVTALTLAISTTLGVIVGTLRQYGSAPIKWLTLVYIEFFRNVPPIVQLFFWYFAVGLDILPAAVIGLSVFSAAYIAETVRSGYLSTPRTQIEAAASSGLNFRQAIFYIVFPQ